MLTGLGPWYPDKSTLWDVQTPFRFLGIAGTINQGFQAGKSGVLIQIAPLLIVSPCLNVSWHLLNWPTQLERPEGLTGASGSGTGQ